MEKMSLKELVKHPELIAEGIYLGEKIAEHAFAIRYTSSIQHILMYRGKDKDLANDICQNALLTVLSKLRKERLENAAQLDGYVHRTAINMYNAYIRKSIRQNTHNDVKLLERIPDPRQNPLSVLSLDITKAAVHLLIESMSHEKYRLILQMHFLEQAPKDEICAKLGIGWRHFDKLFYRAKQYFKKMVEGIE